MNERSGVVFIVLFLLFGAVCFFLVVLPKLPKWVCIRSHEETTQYVTSPINVGGKHFKFPVGGGQIKTQTRAVCDEWRKAEDER